MKPQGRHWTAARLFTLALLLGPFGCQSSPQTEQRETTPNFGSWWAGGEKSPSADTQQEPAPAPAPRAAAEKPATQPMSPGSLAVPTGDPATSGLLVKTIMPAQVRAGAPFTYDIQAINLTNTTLQNVVINTDTYNNLAISSSDPPSTKSPEGDTVWNLGDLAPKATKTIHVTAKAANTGASGSCLSASYNNALCLSTLVVQPSLAVSNTITAEALSCDPITLAIEVTNSGTGSVDNVVVTNSLPAGLKLANGSTTINESVGTLKAGETRKFSYSLRADKSGKFENTAQAKGEGGLTASAKSVNTTIKQPALTLSCAGPDTVYLGREAVFNLTLGNKGDGGCTNTVVSLPIPSGVSFVSATNGGQLQGSSVTWNFPSTAPGASSNFSVTVRPTGISTLSMNATANCVCSAPASTTCSTSVQGIAALLIEGFDDPDPIQVGQSTTYTVTVTNQGSAALTNVKLVCTMEDTMQMVSNTENTSANGMTITFPAIPTLTPKATKTYKVVVKAIKEGQVQFKSEAVSNEITRPTVKIETTHFYK